MTSEAIKKAYNNAFKEVHHPKQENPTTKVDNPTNYYDPSAADSYSFGGMPRFMASGAETIPYGQVGNVKDFDKLGREIFTNNEYKELNPKALKNFRVQYALRYYAEHHKGLDIGKSGVGGWGGDSVIGDKCKNAIDVVMKKNQLKNRDEAMAWLVDQTRSELALRMDKHYFNPSTFAFDLEKPSYVKKPPMKTREEQFKWSMATIYEFEDHRKFGENRAQLNVLWEKKIEPVLVQNGHDQNYIARVKEHLQKVGYGYVHATTGVEKAEGSKKVVQYFDKLMERETRYTWVKQQWESKIIPSLAQNGITADAKDPERKALFLDYKKTFFDVGRDYAYSPDSDERESNKNLLDGMIKRSTSEEKVA
jgi:hypothetical protein